ncbi:3657_t:CDS:10 [Diversispora eburnea]|uniref:3657_t:CDS:1 n=1 Tax=Diversispora eburnea TaxID=1213867 RepID=A0A9N8WKG0_9GLOM|nr:3657_t:CDS:10 [Diversispora eburnea]
MAVTLHEPFEVDTKITTIENQNNLFKIGITIPIELEEKAQLISNSFSNGKGIDGNGELSEIKESLKDDECDENSSSSDLEDNKKNKLTEKILITHQGIGISLYNVNGLQLLNWPIPPKYILTSPAKCIINKGKCLVYSIIHNDTPENIDNVVWLWKSVLPKNNIVGSNDNSETVGRFERPIFSLEISPLLPKRIILINQGGSVSIMDKNLKLMKSFCHFPETSIIIFTLLSITEENSDSVHPKLLKLNFFWIDTQISNDCNILCTLTLKTEIPTTSNFNPLTGKLFLLENSIIRLDGILPFSKISNEKIQESHVVEIAPLSESYLALVGMKKTSESIDQVLTIWDIQYGTIQAEHFVKSNLKDQKNVTSISPYQFQLIVEPKHNLILVSFSKMIPGKSNSFKLSSFLYRYNHEPMTLLSALNRMNSTSEYLNLGEGDEKGFGIIKFGFHHVLEKIEKPVVNDLIKNMRYLRKYESNFLKKLLNAERTSTPEKFSQSFNKYVRNKSWEDFKSFLKKIGLTNIDKYKEFEKDYWKNNLVPLLKSKRVRRKESSKKENNDSEDHEEVNLQLWQELWKEMKTNEEEEIKSKHTERKLYEFIKSGEKIKPELSYNFIQKIVDYCISQNSDGKPNMKFWVPEVIQYFIQNNMISNSIVKGGIVKTLMDREEWDLLQLALVNVPDIPEKDLIYLLKYLISNVSNDQNKKKGLSITKMLLLIIESPRNDNMMRWSLRELTEGELLVTLKKLCDWIEKHDRADITFEPISKQNDLTTITTKRKGNSNFQKIIDFFALILDIHFTSLILNRQLHPLLIRLSNRIAYDVTIFESLESMRSCLELYHKNNLKNEHQTKKAVTLSIDADIPEYTIELFTFFGDNINEIYNPRLDEIKINENEQKTFIINEILYNGEMEFDDKSDEENLNENDDETMNEFSEDSEETSIEFSYDSN